MTSVASKNLYELLGNDLELDPNREPEPPVKVMDKPVARSGKRDGASERPVKDDAKPAAAGGRGGRNNFTGSEQAFRDKNAGASNNRSKPTGEDGVRQDRHPRDPANRARGSRGGRGAGGRGSRTGRDDRHDRTGHAGGNDHTKQAGAAWGHETGNAELNDEKAALADAHAEEAKDGIVADPTPVDANNVPATELPAEEDNVKSYEQYLAEQLEKKAALAGNVEVRKPNEGASKKFPEGKAFARNPEEENFVLPSGGKTQKQKERKTKNTVDIDQAWKEEQTSQGQSQDSGFRGGRGGARGGDRPRGGPRGGRGGPRGGAARGAPREGGAPRGGARSGASPNVGSSSDFPSLGA